MDLIIEYTTNVIIKMQALILFKDVILVQIIMQVLC